MSGVLDAEVLNALTCYASTKHAQAHVQKNPAVKAAMLEEVARIEDLERRYRAALSTPAPAGAVAGGELVEAMCDLLSAMKLKQRPDRSLLFEVEKADFDKARAVYDRHHALHPALQPERTP